MTNSDFFSIFCHILLPVAYEVSQLKFLIIFSAGFFFLGKSFNAPILDHVSQFCPDLVLVCAGFDSAIGDPEVTNQKCYILNIFINRLK